MRNNKLPIAARVVGWLDCNPDVRTGGIVVTVLGAILSGVALDANPTSPRAWVWALAFAVFAVASAVLVGARGNRTSEEP